MRIEPIGELHRRTSRRMAEYSASVPMRAAFFSLLGPRVRALSVQAPARAGRGAFSPVFAALSLVVVCFLVGSGVFLSDIQGTRSDQTAALDERLAPYLDGSIDPMISNELYWDNIALFRSLQEKPDKGVLLELLTQIDAYFSDKDIDMLKPVHSTADGEPVLSGGDAAVAETVRKWEAEKYYRYFAGNYVPENAI